jgi:protein TonB
MQISAFVDKGGRNSGRALLTVNLMLSGLGYSLRDLNKMLTRKEWPRSISPITFGLLLGRRLMAVLIAATLLTAFDACNAQRRSPELPESFVIARDTFWDFGPPFSYYDLIQVTKTADGLSLVQVLVTPHGQSCLQPATVEERSTVLHKSMSELLESRNPCSIPDKDLHREIKRCKKCMVFSGVNVTMEASCTGKDRTLRMDILDRDIYDSRPHTPENTSWSMRILSELNETLGQGSEAKPIFQLGPADVRPVPNTPLVKAISDGRYDDLFGKDSGVAGIVQEARQPLPPPPSVQIVDIAPGNPTNLEMPKYPPIALAARVEGTVEAKFEVNSDGKVQNIVFANEARLKMLQPAVIEAISKWEFPSSGRGMVGKASFRFGLNCRANGR